MRSAGKAHEPVRALQGRMPLRRKERKHEGNQPAEAEIYHL